MLFIGILLVIKIASGEELNAFGTSRVKVISKLSETPAGSELECAMTCVENCNGFYIKNNVCVKVGAVEIAKEDNTDARDEDIYLRAGVVPFDNPYITLIRRSDLSNHVEFQRGWADYTAGFGNPGGNFWIGLQKMHELTSGKKMELHIDLWKRDGTFMTASFPDFTIAGESDNFRISFGSYTGNWTWGDRMTRHNNKPFTTIHRDNDNWSNGNCATRKYITGGWWFDKCLSFMLTDKYESYGLPTAYSGRVIEKGVMKLRSMP